MIADITRTLRTSLINYPNSPKFGTASFSHPSFWHFWTTDGTKASLLSLNSDMYYCRIKKKLFPSVKAHSETIADSETGSSQEVTEDEEMKKKKHRREKIGFRDRKVSVYYYKLFVSFVLRTVSVMFLKNQVYPKRNENYSS